MAWGQSFCSLTFVWLNARFRVEIRRVDLFYRLNTNRIGLRSAVRQLKKSDLINDKNPVYSSMPCK